MFSSLNRMETAVLVTQTVMAMLLQLEEAKHISAVPLVLTEIVAVLESALAHQEMVAAAEELTRIGLDRLVKLVQ